MEGWWWGNGIVEGGRGKVGELPRGGGGGRGGGGEGRRRGWRRKGGGREEERGGEEEEERVVVEGELVGEGGEDVRICGRRLNCDDEEEAIY